MTSKEIAVYVEAELIQAVKLKAWKELKGKSASGVVDWLIQNYLNDKGSR